MLKISFQLQAPFGLSPYSSSLALSKSPVRQAVRHTAWRISSPNGQENKKQVEVCTMQFFDNCLICVESLTCLWTISIVTPNKIYYTRSRKKLFSKRCVIYFIWSLWNISIITPNKIYYTRSRKKLFSKRCVIYFIWNLWNISIITPNKIYYTRFRKNLFSKRCVIYFIWSLWNISIITPNKIYYTRFRKKPVFETLCNIFYLESLEYFHHHSK